MLAITYPSIILAISMVWVIVRILVNKKENNFSWKRELQLMLVYICIVVVARLTFFPFSKVDGRVQPLLFDAAIMFPPRMNLVPMGTRQNRAMTTQFIPST